VKEINAERVVCLTATATERVAKDICKAFDIPDSGLFRTTTYRPNLHLLAESAKTKEELTPKLFQFLRSHRGASIVYVTLQKQTEELANDLRKQNFKARAFHAGLDTQTKTQIQEAFMRDNDLIIVATIAFGMGIDKANIRNVVHFNIPSSLESYSQEIGRAGRDGLVSNCMFYVCGEDLHLREVFARGDLPSRNSVVNLLNDIFDGGGAKYLVGDALEVAQGDQEKEFDLRTTTLKNIYAQLELHFGFLRATTPKYTTYSWKAAASYNTVIGNDSSVSAKAIRMGAVKATKWYKFDADRAALRHSIPRAHIIRKLQELDEQRHIELRTSGILNIYRVLKKLPSTTAEINEIADTLYEIMQAREQQALQRTDQVLDLIKDRRCYSWALAHHFGDSLPEEKKECGHCHWCLTHEAILMEEPSPIDFNRSAFDAILERVKERDDPRLLARIAFGITSPRVSTLKLNKDPLFASMTDHSFMVSLLTLSSSFRLKKSIYEMEANKIGEF
jgi:hypothetical protein